MGIPVIAAAGRWHDDVAALAAPIEPATDTASLLTRRVADLGMVRRREIQVQPAAGGVDQRRVREDGEPELGKGIDAVDASPLHVDVEHDKSAGAPGGNADQRNGPPVPPIVYLCLVVGRGVQAAFDERTLAVLALPLAGEHGPSATGVAEGCFTRAAGIVPRFQVAPLDDPAVSNILSSASTGTRSRDPTFKVGISPRAAAA